MVDPNQPELSIANQCRLLNINRSSFYYRPLPIKAEDLELMRLIDEQYLKTPTWGSRSNGTDVLGVSGDDDVSELTFLTPARSCF